jgi:hypothetical protein
MVAIVSRAQILCSNSGEPSLHHICLSPMYNSSTRTTLLVSTLILSRNLSHRFRIIANTQGENVLSSSIKQCIDTSQSQRGTCPRNVKFYISNIGFSLGAHFISLCEAVGIGYFHEEAMAWGF